ncbi:MAG TPA: DUF4388 domain-containing protein, partial [Acidobacteriota bacterium]|nr:DUF4388 domain-containing protein [Acidobacteriota bacterium]
MSTISRSLSERNVLELLMDWHRNKRTGIIQVNRKQVEKKILFRQGSILRAQSNQESEKLGQILIKKNLIRPVELEIGLTQQKEIVKKLGEVLLDMNLIKQSVLTNTLVSQTRDIIFSLV